MGLIITRVRYGDHSPLRPPFFITTDVEQFGDKIGRIKRDVSIASLRCKWLVRNVDVSIQGLSRFSQRW